jgi:hypothetical protein
LERNISGSLNLLCLGPERKVKCYNKYLSMDMSFILKSMVRVERPIIMDFVLRDQLLMNLKLIIIRS